MKIIILFFVLFCFSCAPTPPKSDWNHVHTIVKTKNCYKVYDKNHALIFDDCDPKMKFPD